jgi:rRNA maturation protein Nop10
MQRCYKCLKALEIKTPAGRRETCPFCGSDLHCCINCVFHVKDAYNECREPQAERVIEKDRSNFCDFFVFRDAEMGGTGKDPEEAVKTKMKSLFKTG